MLLEDCEIIDAYLITALRKYPSYQISVSTYKNTCTFCANVQADDHELLEAKQLLSNTIHKIYSFEKA